MSSSIIPISPDCLDLILSKLDDTSLRTMIATSPSLALAVLESYGSLDRVLTISLDPLLAWLVHHRNLLPRSSLRLALTCTSPSLLPALSTSLRNHISILHLVLPPGCSPAQLVRDLAPLALSRLSFAAPRDAASTQPSALLDDHLLAIKGAGLLHRLEHLSLAHCYALSTSSLTTLCHATRLSHLDLTSLSFDDDELSLVLTSTNLASLSLASCQHFTGHALACLSRSTRLVSLSLDRTLIAAEALQYLPRCLTSLSLVRCAHLDHVDALLTATPHVTRLLLSGCSMLSQGALERIGQGFSRLRELDVSHVRNMTDAVMEAWLEGGGEEEEEEEDAMEVDDAWHMPPSRPLTRLTSLNVSHCPHITSSSLVAIAEHMPLLESLSLASCHEVDALGVAALVQLTSLKTLDLSGAWRLGEDDLVAIVTAAATRSPLHPALLDDDVMSPFTPPRDGSSLPPPPPPASSTDCWRTSMRLLNLSLRHSLSPSSLSLIQHHLPHCRIMTHPSLL